MTAPQGRALAPVEAEVYAAPSGPVEVFIDGVRYLFIPARFGWPGSAIDGIFPTALVDEEQLGHALAGADVVHSIAREWATPLEQAARAAGAAFVETPLDSAGGAPGFIHILMLVSNVPTNASSFL